jgi:uncharacterized protein
MRFETLPVVAAPHAIETISGLYVDVSNPDPDTIKINDIAWALSRISRFNGHTLCAKNWSVGQHSLFVHELVCMVLDPDGAQLAWSLQEFLQAKGLYGEFQDKKFSAARLKLGALMHDAAEAYLTDIPSPVKRYPGLKEAFKELETGLMKAIGDAFSLRPLNKLEERIVLWADLLALRIEAANLSPSRGRGWGVDSPWMNHVDIHLMPEIENWQVTSAQFLSTFEELLNEARWDQNSEEMRDSLHA